MALPKKSTNRYELDRSALYRLRSMKALAAVLLWKGTPSALRALSKRKDNFTEYDKVNASTGKKRHIEAPSDVVKPIQGRLNTLLKQIRVPDYLHSGVPGRSYLTNSLSHLKEKGATVTVDISDFYPSIRRQRVFRLFRNVFECVPDVADAITDLVCCNGHLATGSPASVLLSYFSCKDMFDAMHARALRRGAKFTLYVDDIAITGNSVGHSDALSVSNALGNFGFRSKLSKARVFRKSRPKVVTGRAFRNGRSRAPNKQHLSMHEALQASDLDPRSVKKKRAAIGKLDHVGALDEIHGGRLRDAATKMRTMLPPIKHRRRMAKSFRKRG